MDLEAALDAWGLSHLSERCLDMRFSYQSLVEFAPKEAIDEITPHPGERILLWGQIQKARAQLSDKVAFNQPRPSQATASKPTEVNQAGPSQASGSPSQESCGEVTDDQPSTSKPSRESRKRKIGSVAASQKLSELSNSKVIDQLDIEAVLRKSTIGTFIVDYYQGAYADEEDEDDIPSVRLLSETQRDQIVQLVVEHLNMSTANLPHQLLSVVATKIKDLFPTEIVNTYYAAPGEEGKLGPSGKLYNRLRNTRGNKKPRPKENSTTKTDHTSNRLAVLQQPITSEVSAAQLWLATARSPWPEVLRKWVLTAPIRFKQVFQHDSESLFINQYLDNWEVLKHKSGYELLLEDFNVLYPASRDLLYTHWEAFCSATIALGRDVKDSHGKCTLKLLTSKEGLSSDAQAALLLDLLPSIRASHRVAQASKCVKVSCPDARSRLFLHLKVASNIKQSIREARNSFLEDKGRPLIVLVGQDLTKIEATYVSVCDLAYKLHGVLSAIDVAFKIFHSLNTPYPPETNHIWMVIQRSIYKLNTDWDHLCDIKHSWINSYKF